MPKHLFNSFWHLKEIYRHITFSIRKPSKYLRCEIYAFSTSKANDSKNTSITCSWIQSDHLQSNSGFCFIANYVKIIPWLPLRFPTMFNIRIVKRRSFIFSNTLRSIINKNAIHSWPSKSFLLKTQKWTILLPFRKMRINTLSVVLFCG